MKSDYDLIVVGAGIIGAACADYASTQSLRVLMVEPGVVGGGVTAASMGHLAAVDGDPAELALAGYSQKLWDALRQLPGNEYSQCGTLWVAQAEDELERVPGMRARLAKVGVESEPVDAHQLYELEPQLAPNLAGGLLVASEGIVYAPAVTRQLVARAGQQGAQLLRARAKALGDHEVILEDGRHVRGNVLVANGCGVPELLPELPLRGRRGHLVITQRYPAMIHHQLVQLHYADSVSGSGDSVAFNVQPRPTGQLLIGSSRDYRAATSDVSLPVVRRMLRCAFEFLPALRQLEALRIWAGLRPTSADGLPYLGKVPGRPGIWVAGGHEGLGVCTAPGSAHLVIDQLLGYPTAIDHIPYDPARVMA